MINQKNSKVGGKIVTDQISLANSTTAEDIQFLYVTEEQGISNMWNDGVLGLAPSKKRDVDPPVFIQEFYRNGAINHNMFSLHFGEEESSLWLGGYSYNFIRRLGKNRHVSN